jgi:two-component system chemotaxis response regulator CheY
MRILLKKSFRLTYPHQSANIFLTDIPGDLSIPAIAAGILFLRNPFIIIKDNKMNKKIMVVDDSHSVRQMICFSLKRADFEILEAGNGEDALQKINGSLIDMLITDLDMPKMGGIELIKNIRRISKYRAVPIAILTTESDDSVKQKAKAAGANGWITKPFRPNQLVGVVNRMLGLSV